ncbi:hypothetical protein EV363DRAFT_1162077 [Boletus edulis]|nr:hypothetical protein EV363DRAFT_1162077 [Boletus edulis]
MDVYELDTCVEQLRTQLTPEDVSKFYKRVVRLPRATFSNRCLRLPCITFAVTKIGILDARGSQGIHYHAIVSLLGKVEFRTTDVFTLTKPRKLVFVHPWLRDLSDDHDESVSDDESEDESDADSSEAPKPNADSGDTDDDDNSSAPASPLHAPSARVDRYTQALRLFSHLGHPFNALLLERQPNNQYKRVATEHEIIISGVPYQTNPKDIRVKVLEIV